MGAAVTANHAHDPTNDIHTLKVDPPKNGRYSSAGVALTDPRVLKQMYDLGKAYLPSLVGHQDADTALQATKAAHIVTTAKSLPGKWHEFNSAFWGAKGDYQSQDAWQDLLKKSADLGSALATVVKAADEYLHTVNLPAPAKKVLSGLETTCSTIKQAGTLSKVWKDMTTAKGRSEQAQCVTVLAGAIFASFKLCVEIIEKIGHDVKAQPVVAKVMEIGAILMVLGLIVHNYRKAEEERVRKHTLAAAGPFHSQKNCG